MDNSLYFLPSLMETPQHPKPQQSLEDAFARIQELGTQDGYSEGFSNFRRFMGIACSHGDAADTDYARALIAELATGIFEGPEQENLLLAVIGSHPAWKAEYEEMCAEQAGQSPSRESMPAIGVFGPAGQVGEMVFEHVPGRISMDGILPGVYLLRLSNTGRVLWEGDLTAKDLIWTAAYGARNLDLAAQTEDAERPSTHKWVLWGGDVILRTFAGIENGTIEIELAR
jgi:hypothetical protein